MRLLALLAAALFSAGALAQKDIPVRFALDWRFEGPAAPYFVAIDKGYYKAEGINVSIDAAKVKIENIGFPVREPMLAQGKVDAITGFWFSSYMNLKANGVKDEDIVVLHMRDHGVDLYGNVILANPDFMRFSPKVVAGF